MARGRVVKCEANMPLTSIVIAQFLLKMNNRKCWPWKFRSTSRNITKYNMRNSETNINVSKSHNLYFYDGSHRFRDINISHFFTLKIEVKVTEYNIRNCHSVVKTSLYRNHSAHFTLALTVSEILRFEMFDTENLGQGQEYNIHNGPIWWWTSTSISHNWAFVASFQRYPYLIISNCVILKM